MPTQPWPARRSQGWGHDHHGCDITTLATNFTTASRTGRSAAHRPDGWRHHRLHTDTSSAYGAVSNLGSAGRYEFIGVEGVAQCHHAGLRPQEWLQPRGQDPGHPRSAVHHPDHQQRGFHHRLPRGMATTGGVVAVHAETTVTLAGTGKSTFPARVSAEATMAATIPSTMPRVPRPRMGPVSFSTVRPPRPTAPRRAKGSRDIKVTTPTVAMAGARRPMLAVAETPITLAAAAARTRRVARPGVVRASC
jgi:hypothetical protein